MAYVRSGLVNEGKEKYESIDVPGWDYVQVKKSNKAAYYIEQLQYTLFT